MTATAHPHKNAEDERIDRIAAEAEAHKEDPIPAGAKVSRGHDRSRVLQVRLNDDELATLTELADAADVRPSTFARQILLDAMQQAMAGAARDLLGRETSFPARLVAAVPSKGLREAMIRMLVEQEMERSSR